MLLRKSFFFPFFPQIFALQICDKKFGRTFGSPRGEVYISPFISIGTSGCASSAGRTSGFCSNPARGSRWTLATGPAAKLSLNRFCPLRKAGELTASIRAGDCSNYDTSDMLLSSQTSKREKLRLAVSTAVRPPVVISVENSSQKLGDAACHW